MSQLTCSSLGYVDVSGYRLAQVDRIWGIWGSYYESGEFNNLSTSGTVGFRLRGSGLKAQVSGVLRCFSK